MTRNLDIAKDAGDFFENHYSSGTFSGAHSGTSTGTHSGPISTSATFPTGMVLNVVSSSKTDIQTFTSTNTFETITGLSCAITPKSTSSKILIMGHLSVGNNVKIGGGSGVVKDIKDNQIVMGYPAVPLKNFLKGNK